MNAEQNYSLLQGIDANRRFLLQAYRDNPDLLARAEPSIRRLIGAGRENAAEAAQTAVSSAPTFSSAADHGRMR